MPSYLLKKLGIVVFFVNLTKTPVNAAFTRDYFLVVDRSKFGAVLQV